MFIQLENNLDYDFDDWKFVLFFYILGQNYNVVKL